MTFAEWNDQLHIPFDEWFLHEWDDGWLRTDDRVSKYIIRNFQEVSIQIKHDFLKETYISVFKIGNRFFRIKWFYIYDGNICTSPIEEVRKETKNIELDYYVLI